MGLQGGDPVFQPHHGFRRRAHQGHIAEIHEIQIRRRVDIPLGPVQAPQVRRGFAQERLGNDRLDDVAGPDVFLGFGNMVPVGLFPVTTGVRRIPAIPGCRDFSSIPGAVRA